MAARFQVIPAAYLYLLRGPEVLLQQRAGTGYMDGFWVAGAAGHIELHETAADCVVREAAEELGVLVDAADLVPLTVMQRTDGSANPVEQRVDWFFVSHLWTGEPHVAEETKCSAVGWHYLNALPKQVPHYERRVLTALASGNVPAFTAHGF